MPLMDDLLADMKSAPEETVAEETAKEETVETVETDKAEDHVDEPKSEGNFAEERTDLTKSAFDDTKPEETEQPAEQPPEQPKPDLKTVSKEEKAEHAFKRQLSKQREKMEEKHQKEIEDLKASFSKEISDLKESLKPKEPLKTRADFPLGKGGDDAYIKYLVKQGMDEERAEQAARDAEKAAKADEEAREAQAERERTEEEIRVFSANSHNAFKDEARYNEYVKGVTKALNNGLGEVLDSAPTLRNFIYRNPEGPIVLDRMLRNREDFVKVMSQGDPTMMIIAAHEVASRPEQTAQPEQPAEAPKVPHLGKPGARNVSSEAGSMFGSDKDLIAYIRNVGNRRK